MSQPTPTELALIAAQMTPKGKTVHSSLGPAYKLWQEAARLIEEYEREPAAAPAPVQPEVIAAAPEPPKHKFAKPTLGELKTYAMELKFPLVEAERFNNFYESNGWKVGQNGMKDWKAAMRNWALSIGATARMENGKHARSVLDLKTVLLAKEKLLAELRNKHRTEAPMGSTWDDEGARLKAVALGKEIKEVNEQIARMG